MFNTCTIQICINLAIFYTVSFNINIYTLILNKIIIHPNAPRIANNAGLNVIWLISSSQGFSQLHSIFNKVDLECLVFEDHWLSSHYAVTHMRNKNSDIQGRLPTG